MPRTRSNTRLAVRSAGKAVLVEAGVGGRRQLDLHLGILQDDAVIAGPRDFVLVREGAKISFLVLRGRRGAQRRNADVAQVGATRPAQVVMAEAEDRLVLIVISGAVFPPGQPRVGAELDHAEGNRRARIGVPEGRGADHRVGRLQGRGFARQARAGQASQEQAVKDKASGSHAESPYRSAVFITAFSSPVRHVSGTGTHVASRSNRVGDSFIFSIVC